MPPSVDSPVQARLPIPVLDGVLGSGKNGSGAIQTRPVGQRRIFVQTDTGSMLGIELHRADNAQMVKKKMQAVLNVSTEQMALVFGDMVFKGDLSEVRNDSPLLLTRKLQRSLSTPCIYPSPDAQVSMDGGQSFEVVGGVRCCPKMKQILNAINEAIMCGVEPVAVSGGLGGAYYFRNTDGDSVAIVKPTDEEPFAPNNPKGYVGRSLGQPGLKKAVRVGETGVREVAAYLLDHEHFAKVPPTVLLKVAHHAFNVNGASTVHKGHAKVIQPVAKLASCQQFVPHDYDASDHGTSHFSVSAVHRIGILDIRIFNTDRHAGNILIRKRKPLDRTSSCSNVHGNGSLELIPIDHGLCLPEALEDPYFEWLHWPQASLPFSKEELDYIRRLDEHKDADTLRQELPMLREACFRMLILSTTLLKRAAAAGFCLAELGEMMSRDGIEEASQLELLCKLAKLEVEEELLADKLCCNDGCNEAAGHAISVGDALCDPFEFVMDQEFDYKWNFVSNECWSPQKETDSCAFSYLASPDQDFTLSPNFLMSSRVPLKIVPELSALEEEEYLSNPCKVSAGGSRLWNGGNAFQENGFMSPRARSLKSVSFQNHKQGVLDCQEQKTLASETTRKVKANGGSPPFSLGDMSEVEWSLFMDHFEGLLEDALARKQDSGLGHRQRRGMSCQS